MIEPYTVTLTSCGRFDLLERTLDSLIPCLEESVEKIIVAEDSGDSSVRDVAKNFIGSGIEIETIVNLPKLGQIRSIDRLYSRVNTEWIFHCEDDWEFLANGFIGESFAILKEFDSCSMVSLRGHNSFAEDCFLPENITESGVRYYVADTLSGWRFSGLQFNPGLRRMRDYRIVGPYAELGKDIGESRVSRAYEALGYRTICLSRPFVRHIGVQRHVFATERDRTRHNKLKRAIVKPIRKVYWKLNPKAHPYSNARQRFERQRNCFTRWRNWDGAER